jgi:hypothetical protein
MTCYKEIQLIEYLDGEMDPKNSKQLEYHVKACQSCQQILEYLKTEQHLIKDAINSEEKSVDIQQIFHDRLKKKRLSSILLSRRSSWLKMAAGVFLLGIGLSLFFWFQNDRGPAKETEVIVFNTKIEEKEAESFIYESGETDVKYIWFEKEQTEQ